MGADAAQRDFMIEVGIIGGGYWGPNLLRNFSQNPKARVRAVAEGMAA